MSSKFSLTIGWLYPDLMSIYGDRGNIICLQKRCDWRGISVKIQEIFLDSDHKLLAACDLLFMGGAQDSQQSIVAQDLKKKKKTLSDMIEKGIPGLYICGGFQYLGKYYKEADGTIIEQLGIIDIYTENPGRERLTGNIAVRISPNFFPPSFPLPRGKGTKGEGVILVGFENHGGRTHLGKNILPLGKVLAGYGSNEQEGTEGAIYKNSIGSYLHGPILPKNPELADWLINKALAIKYKKEHNLELIDDSLALNAKNKVLKRLNII